MNARELDPLGAQETDRSKRFYTEGLGWKVHRDYGISFFGPHGSSLSVSTAATACPPRTVRARGAAASVAGPHLHGPQRDAVHEIMAEADRPAPPSSSSPPPEQWGGSSDLVVACGVDAPAAAK
jgi:catechol 2,3-dioxygenase-like lactoylglutathione lyase family enzyme